MTEPMSVYTIEAERSGRQWQVKLVGPSTEADEGPDVVPPFKTRTVDQLHERGLKLLSQRLGIALESVEMTVDLQQAIGGVSEEAWNEHDAALALASLQQHAGLRARELQISACQRLEAAGFTLRDIGALLDLSSTRVHQLLALGKQGPRSEEEEDSDLEQPSVWASRMNIYQAIKDVEENASATNCQSPSI